MFDKVSIKEILIGERKRTAGDVADLAASIKKLGLLNPITVCFQEDHDVEKYMLVAGVQRTKPARRMVVF